MNLKKIALVALFSVVLQPLMINAYVPELSLDKIKTIMLGSNTRKAATFLGGAVIAGFSFWRLFPVFESFSSNKAVKALGFNPDPEGRNLNSDGSELKEEYSSKNIVLGMHGFENPRYILNQYVPKKFAENNMELISCNPKSSSLASGGILSGIRAIDFGGENDASVILYYLLLCHKQGHKAVNAFGESRGGAGWITALCMLSEPQKYVSQWKKLGVITKDGSLDTDKISELKKMVQNGHIYLAYPWIDSDYPFKDICKNLGIPQSIGTFFIKLALHLGTDYSMWRPSTHVLLKKLTEKSEFNITVDFAKGDRVVGNMYDDEFKNNKSVVFINKSKYHMDRYDAFAEALIRYKNNKNN